jgi:predicted P-loop ATPase
LPKELDSYYQENPDLKDKDTQIAVSQCIMFNFDELGAMNRYKLEFKSLMSAGNIRVRKHYAASASSHHRICSMVASTNEFDFIIDESGSVRYLCFEVIAIDFNYTAALNIDNLWAQAYYMYKSDKSIGEMSKEEIEENMLANEQFMDQPELETIIRRHYRKPRNGENAILLTATELKEELSKIYVVIHWNEITLGKALKNLFGNKRSCSKDKTKRYSMIRI